MAARLLTPLKSMCGIVGYIGKQQAGPVIVEGLRRLEYRGYDSAGLAIIRDQNFELRKKKGKIDEGLSRLLATEPAQGQSGIGHTRCATHGPPSNEHSHTTYDQNSSS